jgi:hypothetical protein
VFERSSGEVTTAVQSIRPVPVQRTKLRGTGAAGRTRLSHSLAEPPLRPRSEADLHQIQSLDSDPASSFNRRCS